MQLPTKLFTASNILFICFINTSSSVTVLVLPSHYISIRIFFEQILIYFSSDFLTYQLNFSVFWAVWAFYSLVSILSSAEKSRYYERAQIARRRSVHAEIVSEKVTQQATRVLFYEIDILFFSF